MSTIITLTRAQRDGLRDHIGYQVDHETSTLLGAARDADSGPGEAKQAFRHLGLYVELLDQVGWEELGSHPEYRLGLTDESRALIGSFEGVIREAIEDDHLRLDYEALAAVELVQAVTA